MRVNEAKEKPKGEPERMSDSSKRLPQTGNLFGGCVGRGWSSVRRRKNGGRAEDGDEKQSGSEAEREDLARKRDDCL